MSAEVAVKPSAIRLRRARRRAEPELPMTPEGSLPALRAAGKAT